ncbi:hypothetical protein SAMN02927930_02129, partial [Pseudidiomarina indica]
FKKVDDAHTQLETGHGAVRDYVPGSDLTVQLAIYTKSFTVSTNPLALSRSDEQAIHTCRKNCITSTHKFVMSIILALLSMNNLTQKYRLFLSSGFSNLKA